MVAKSVLTTHPPLLRPLPTLLQYFGRPFSLIATHVDGLRIKISARNRGCLPVSARVHVLVYPVTQGEQ